MGTNPKREQVFRFKQFSVENSLAAMKVGTDGVLLGAWTDTNGCDTALDVGTGCGLISLMLAQRNPSLSITGIDIVDEAVAEASKNFHASPWGDRLRAEVIDFNILAGDVSKSFDLIVSNPPFYLTDIHSPDKMRTAARHGHNLTPLTLIEGCKNGVLATRGRLCMITPAEQADEIEFRAALAGLYVARRTDVHTKAQAPARRILWDIRKGVGKTISDTLLIGSDTYTSLTSPFYLH